MYRTNDPEADLECWLADEAKYFAKLPKCTECEEPIQDDYLYVIDDKIYCSECVDKLFRKDAEDYVR